MILQEYFWPHTVHSTRPFSVRWSIFATTALEWLQNGHEKVVSTLGIIFFGGGLLDFRLPCKKVAYNDRVWGRLALQGKSIHNTELCRFTHHLRHSQDSGVRISFEKSLFRGMYSSQKNIALNKVCGLANGIPDLLCIAVLSVRAKIKEATVYVYESCTCRLSYDVLIRSPRHRKNNVHFRNPYKHKAFVQIDYEGRATYNGLYVYCTCTRVKRCIALTRFSTCMIVYVGYVPHNPTTLGLYVVMYISRCSPS